MGREGPLLHVALVEPKIPQNTGTIGRLTTANRLELHLVGELGFDLDEKAVRRAGLDYWRHAVIHRVASLDALRAALPCARFFWFSRRAARRFTDVRYRSGDCLVFGDEVTGLSDAVIAAAGENAVRIPQSNPVVRSLNLANAVSVAVYEALRQLGFPGETLPDAADAAGEAAASQAGPEGAGT